MAAPDLNFVLAKGDPTLGFIFLLIWVIVIAVSIYQKVQEAAGKRGGNRPMQLPPNTTSGPTVPMPRKQRPPTKARPMPSVTRAQRPVQRPISVKQAPKTPRAPQAPARPVIIKASEPAPAPQPAAREEIEASAARAMAIAPRVTGPAVSAGEIARGLRPHNFRKLYIVTELLQPPISLREIK